MPGTDPDAISRWIVDTFAADLPFVPELPERGPHAAMIGRTLSLLDLPVDALLGRWRIGAAQGMDQERAHSLYRRDLDAIEEALAGEPTQIKQQFAGPFTLAATTELRSGETVLSDDGAFRELAEALTEVIREQGASLRKRFGVVPVIQIDEPAAPAVFAGQIRTSSGYGRYRSVSADNARRIWSQITRKLAAEDTTSVLHCCAPDVPVELARDSGFDGISADLALLEVDDAWARAIDEELEFWTGSVDPKAIENFLGRVGFSIADVHERLVISPACGLADHTPKEARAVLEQAISTRSSLSS